MKIIITENQLNYVLEQNQEEQLCLSDFNETVNSFLDGVVKLSDDEIYSAYEDPMTLANEIKDPKTKMLFENILKRLENMSIAQVLSELKKLISIKKTLKEQQTPYLEQNITIAGVEMPKVVAHSILGLLIILFLSKIIVYLDKIMNKVKTSGRRRRSNVVGCQASRGRAMAIRRRRRRENWKSFLKRLGIR